MGEPLCSPVFYAKTNKTALFQKNTKYILTSRGKLNIIFKVVRCYGSVGRAHPW